MTKHNEGIVEFICEGGHGGEARVDVELRTKFPGIGGSIITQEGAVAALRAEYYPAPKSGHRMFLRHMIIKKLDDYFFRKHLYKFAHIPRAFGSISEENRFEAYLYEWVFGTEGFPWKASISNNEERLEDVNIELSDWNIFASHFNAAGINMQHDIADADNGDISKNIIHKFYYNPGNLSSIWKRIDFGYNSTPIDYDKLSRFLHDKREDLISVLRNERYEMLRLAVDYLNKENMEEIDIGRLEVLIGDYRCSSLRHFTSRGQSSGAGGPYPIIEYNRSL